MKKFQLYFIHFLIYILLALFQSCEEDDFYKESETTVTDIDGNIYSKVVIGDQVWMGENLRTTRYSNGSEIELVEDQNTWDIIANSKAVYCYYVNEKLNADPYGALYSWTAAMNKAESSNKNPSKVQGACPSGWHIPSKAEWDELVDYLGGKDIAGAKMKEAGTAHWYENEGATNESGFTALPAGIRYYNDYFGGGFGNMGYWSIHWSSTLNANTQIYTCGVYPHSEASVIPRHSGRGYSVRCVKD